MTNEEKKRLGDWLRVYRAINEITGREAAKRIGLDSQGYVSKVERGETRMVPQKDHNKLLRFKNSNPLPNYKSLPLRIKLKVKRAEYRMTQEEMATCLDISKSTLSLIESQQEYSYPNNKTRKVIEKKLNQRFGSDYSADTYSQNVDMHSSESSGPDEGAATDTVQRKYGEDKSDVSTAYTVSTLIMAALAILLFGGWETALLIAFIYVSFSQA